MTPEGGLSSLSRTVEITPEVLAWAIGEDAIPEGELAGKVGVTPGTVRDWVEGRGQPSRGQFSRLVDALHRPRALFFLPTPPSAAGVPAQLRAAPGLVDHDLSSTERRLIRRARRLQREAGWLLEERVAHAINLPELHSSLPPAEAGFRLRDWIGVAVGEQLAWENPYVALREWRRVIDERGVSVLQLQLGGQGLRGFSLFDEYAPLIAVNTAYNAPARIFTIFHELAHLAARSDSACAAFFGPDTTSTLLRLERWCEEVASAALLPRDAIEREVRERLGPGEQPAQTFDQVRRIAERFKVSIRAAAIRLIRLELAPVEVYGAVESRAQFVDRPQGGGGGGGRPTARKRLDEFGRRLPGLFLDAVEEGAIPMRDALDLVGITTSQVDELRGLINSSGR